MTAATIPHRVTGLLEPFVTAGLLESADVHVATQVPAMAGDNTELVALATAFTVRALRQGSVCLFLTEVSTAAAVISDMRGEAEQTPSAKDQTGTDLPWPDPETWLQALRSSPAVSVGVDGPTDRPLRLVADRLYLDRYWRDELTVRTMSAPATPARSIDEAALAASAARLFPVASDDVQRQAVIQVGRSRLTVITGGPGTGKTTTVARLVAALQEAAHTGMTKAGLTTSAGLRVALAAPTGKAAARMQEAVNEQVAGLSAGDQKRVGQLQATTVHRLLGWKPGSTTRFIHDRQRTLPHDLVIVDESSMVSLSLMARLLEALAPWARIVLVGDPDQLTSVEAGAVLGDLVAGHQQQVVRLTQVHRYGTQLAAVAEAIRTGDVEQVMDLLRSADTGEASVMEVVEPQGAIPSGSELNSLHADVSAAGRALVLAAVGGDAEGALTALNQHRLLLAHRHGPAGVSHWNTVVAQWVAQSTAVSTQRTGSWRVGDPLLVTENDRATGLYNGDTGVVIADPESGSPIAVFGTPGSVLRVRPYQLPRVQSVHAMTVHRAQGSQFAQVSVLLPVDNSPLLTRELLYTAVTRARRQVRILGTESAIRQAVGTAVRRASGLRFNLGDGL